MRSDLRHTVFSAARFSDILRRSYRAKPAISCFIALQRFRAYHFPFACSTIIQYAYPDVKQFFDLFYNLCSHFSVETPIFSVESLLWSFYPKYRLSFPFTSVISPCVSAPRCGSDRPPPLRCRRRDAPPPLPDACRSFSASPGTATDCPPQVPSKKFFRRRNKTASPCVI